MVEGKELEAALERQEEVAAEEKGRFDHEEIEAGNREYIDQVKVMRKRHRKNEQVDGLDQDSDVDDDFKKELI